MDSLSALGPGNLENNQILDKAECSDPRDKLYSIYGLAKDLHFPNDLPRGPLRHLPLGVFVHYESSFEDYYIRFAAACVNAGHLRQIIHQVILFGSLCNRDPSLPS